MAFTTIYQLQFFCVAVQAALWQRGVMKRSTGSSRWPLVALLTLLFSAASTAAEKPLRVVASFYPMYVTTLNVVGDAPGVTVSCLTEPFVGCLHDYQLKADDLKALSKADVFVANGAGMESFLSKVLQQLPKLKIVDASANAKLLPDGNAHVWVSLTGAAAQTHHIAEELAKIAPDRAEAFLKNGAAYEAKLKALHDEIVSALKDAKSRDIITFHEAFPYFAAEFGLNVVGVVEREPGAEPNARELADTIRLIRSKKDAALFAEPQYPSQSAGIIARETGVQVHSLDPVATGPIEPAKARDYYVEKMRENLNALKEALAP
jgi:zinc transport system substrate-binding protein